MENYDNIEFEKLIAYPKRQNLTVMMFFCAFVALISILSFFSGSYITGILLGLLFCILIWMIPWKENFKPKLIVDFKGIRLNNVSLANWTDLKIIEISTYYDSDGIKHEKLIVDKFEIELDDLELDRYDLEKIIKKYRLMNKTTAANTL